MMSLGKWVTRIKAFIAINRVKIGTKLLNRRNRAPAILIYPDPRLKRVAKEVDFNKYSRDDLVKIVRKMGAALNAVTYGDRLGLAAPQIGIDLRICIVKGAVMVNPTWKPTKAPPETSVESCYSVPHKFYEVKRAQYGWAQWYSIDGVGREFKLKGLDAIIFQHELDHLDGKCCIDVGVLLKDNSKDMKKFKVIEDFVMNGKEYKKDDVVSLDYQQYTLKSIKDKIIELEGHSNPKELAKDPTAPPPVVGKDTKNVSQEELDARQAEKEAEAELKKNPELDKEKDEKKDAPLDTTPIIGVDPAVEGGDTTVVDDKKEKDEKEKDDKKEE